MRAFNCARFDDIAARDAGAAAGGVDLAGEQANGGGLARAVGAEQAKDVAAPHAEADARRGLFRAEAAAQVVGLDHHIRCVRHTSLLIVLSVSVVPDRPPGWVPPAAAAVKMIARYTCARSARGAPVRRPLLRALPYLRMQMA